MVGERRSRLASSPSPRERCAQQLATRCLHLPQPHEFEDVLGVLLGNEEDRDSDTTDNLDDES